MSSFKFVRHGGAMWICVNVKLILAIFAMISEVNIMSFCVV